MSSISTNIGNSSYYQLNGSSGNTTGQSNISVASLATSLLNPNSTSNGSTFSDAYTLDLSPAAQQYLAGNPTSASSSISSANKGFVLSSKQREEVSEIIAKYKDQPFTQDTYNKIQDDLNAAGLSPQKLSMIDKATSFNPTQILVSALTGKPASNASDTSDAAQQTKSTNFMQQIMAQWKAISTTADDAATPSDTPADAVTAAGGASAG